MQKKWLVKLKPQLLIESEAQWSRGIESSYKKQLRQQPCDCCLNALQDGLEPTTP